MVLTKFKRQIRLLLNLVYGLWGFMIVSSGMDIYLDIRFHATLRHILTESATLVACVTSALLLMFYFSKITTLTIHEVESKLKSNELEATSLKNKNKQLMQGLAENIQQQFKLWDLSKQKLKLRYCLSKASIYSYKYKFPPQIDIRQLKCANNQLHSFTFCNNYVYTTAHKQLKESACISCGQKKPR